MRVLNQALRRLRVRADRGLPASENVRLLEPDLFPGVAKERRMVDADGGDHGDVRINGIDGVEPPAQADFQNHDVGLCILEALQNAEPREFKISKRHPGACLFDFAEGADERLVVDFAAVEERTFVEAQQMGRRMKRRPEARFPKNGLNKGAGRTLAVRARDCNDG